MSLLLRTIRAFPRGRTIEELHALVGSSFLHEDRMALLAELELLAAEGKARRLSDGRWMPVSQTALTSNPAGKTPPSSLCHEANLATAAPFQRQERQVNAIREETEDADLQIDPLALLRYWRSALRADPRGAITETEDRHGSVWHLIAGTGPIVPDEGRSVVLSIDLDALAPDFRAALLRREGNENALAVGWPIAIGRRSGVPAVWPVGLLSGEWRRVEGRLEVEVSADDVLVNPDWLKGAARMTGWRAKDLENVFAPSDGVGLETADFLSRLRDAAASQIRGKVAGEWLASELDLGSSGIFDAAALFLPDDSTFTSGAVRDLDSIASWPRERLARTALAPLLGLHAASPANNYVPINAGSLNAEQIDAVRKACSAPLTVVTGPPGTGKSQAIVSMAASVLLGGGSVLVASKNHQALDAVEDRLGGLAPDIPFIVRTLDPAREIDRSFTSLLADLVNGEEGWSQPSDTVLLSRLEDLGRRRVAELDRMQRRFSLECEIAETIERIDAHRKHLATSHEEEQVTARPSERLSLWKKLFRWISTLFRGRREPDETSGTSSTGLSSLQKKLESLRKERDQLGDCVDVLALTEQIADLARNLLAAALKHRATISPDDRERLDNAKADLEFSGSKAPLPFDLAKSVISHRPLWLASVLGTPKRVPLEDALFDLVIFDEASQCDIASAIPLFARARRAVVVGDNRQLNFIAQLGQAQDRNLMQAQGLPVAKMSRFAQSRQSLFDFAQRVPGAERVLLRQQYRSVGPIVDYISKEFYGNALKVAYDPATIRPPAGQKPGLAWTHVPSPAIYGPNNVNRAEVAAIVAHLERLLMAEGYSGTVGVTSPFRGQVHAIEEAVRSAIPSHKLEAAEFRVATVDGFQGQERDVILFSPTLGTSSAMSAVAFVQKDHRRLNVAISRARAVAHVFGDLEFARSGKVKTMAALASAATEPRKRSGEGTFDSDWERIVYHALIARHLKPQPQFEIAGRRLDFALFGAGGIKLDLEIDGRQFHQNADGQRKLSDHWRDHQLRSLGWRVRRIWVDELAKDMEACLDLVERDLS